MKIYEVCAETNGYNSMYEDAVYDYEDLCFYTSIDDAKKYLQKAYALIVENSAADWNAYEEPEITTDDNRGYCVRFNYCRDYEECTVWIFIKEVELYDSFDESHLKET